MCVSHRKVPFKRKIILRQNHPCHTYDWVMLHTWCCFMSYRWVGTVTNQSVTPVTHSCHLLSHILLVGSLKSKVSFAEYRLFYRALLQKRPIILRSLQVVAFLSHILLSHIQMRHVTNMHRSYRTLDLVMSHIFQKNHPCHAYDWVMCHIRHVVHGGVES